MRKTWILIVVLVIAAVALLAWRFTRAAVAVDVVHPQLTTIRAYVEEQAVTRLPVDFPISMPIAGWLEPISLREGDAVRANDIIAKLEMSDLRDRVSQAEQRIAVLETNIRNKQDNRLELNALKQSEAAVKALDETVAAAEKRAEASQAVTEFARSELDRVTALNEGHDVTDRELREATANYRRSEADHQGDVLTASALKTLATVSYLGPQFIRDYMDRKGFDIESLQNQLAEARTALDMEQRNLARAEIRSPIDGVVLERHQTRHQFLPAGTMLLRLGRLEDLEVVAEILTERATRLRPGNPVDIFGEALPTGVIHGKVTRIYPSGFQKISSLGVEQQRVLVAIQLDQRPPELGAEFRVQVRIFHAEAADALVVPRPALFRGPTGQWQLMLVDSGRLRVQDVTLGILNDEQAQITSGLSESAAVVARPARDLTEGLRVRTQPAH
jgi:HlyD family secretion protein